MKTYGKEKSLKNSIFKKIQLIFKIVQNLNCKLKGLQKVYDGENLQGIVLMTMLCPYSGYFPLVMLIS